MSDNPDWLDEIVEADRRIAELEAELHKERMKNQNSLANNLCPDHRGKQGSECLSCLVESLSVYKQRWETVERLVESRGFTDQEWVILFKVGGKDFAQAIDAAGGGGAE